MPDEYMEILDLTEVVTLRVSRKQLEKLKGHASAQGISQSELLRNWIDYGDLFPHIPSDVVSKLRYIAWGQKREARQLIEGVLRREWQGRLGWD